MFFKEPMMMTWYSAFIECNFAWSTFFVVGTWIVKVNLYTKLHKTLTKVGIFLFFGFQSQLQSLVYCFHFFHISLLSVNISSILLQLTLKCNCFMMYSARSSFFNTTTRPACERYMCEAFITGTILGVGCVSLSHPN